MPQFLLGTINKNKIKEAAGTGDNILAVSRKENLH
jgi:hypothetical protein